MKSQDVILGILMQSSMSGYDIKQQFERLFSHFYNASYGTIYPTLSKMEQEGLITKSSFVQEGKPNKNLYTITEKGKTAFYAYLDSEIQDVEIKSDYMIRLYFGELAGTERVKRWLVEGIRRNEAALSVLRAEYDKWRNQISPTQLLCMKIGISNTESVLKNLKEGLEQLEREPSI